MVTFRKIFYLITTVIIAIIFSYITYYNINRTENIKKLKIEEKLLKKDNKINKKELTDIKEEIKKLNKKNLNNLKYIVLKKDVDLINNMFVNIIRYSNKINLFKINNLKISKDKRYINIVRVSLDLKSSYKLLTEKESINLFINMINKYIKINNLKTKGTKVSFYITKDTIKDIKND